MNKLFVLAGFILLCELAGVIGSIFTLPSIPAWYAGLVKPSFSPPNWLFGPVWVTLYLLMGISAYLVWEKLKENNAAKNPAGAKAAQLGLLLFAVQLVLNAKWSFLFFGLHSPFLGLVCIVFLWLAIVLTIWQFSKVSRNAALLLLPYLLWVSFASLLNYFIFALN